MRKIGNESIEKYKNYLIDEARKQAHTKIYQSINPSYTPLAPQTDLCYADTPAVDMAVYTVINKLLIEAHTLYLQK